MNIKDITPEQIAKSVKESFERGQKYPTMTVRGLRKALESLSGEYDECPVFFTFLVKDYGPSEENDGMKNFIVGTIPIKCVVRNPDQIRMLLCDDQAMEYFSEFTNSDKTSL